MKEELSETVPDRPKYIGILGGNFNPVHNGHLSIAQKAYEQFHLDEVWFMPAWIQPLKQGLPVAPAEDRARMVELALWNVPQFSLCSYELEKKGVSYTCETLKALCRIWPDCKFFFILGADSIYSFDTWKHPEEICACASLLVACRHQEGMRDEALFVCAEKLRRKYNADIAFIDTPFYDISSTDIRTLLKTEQPQSVSKDKKTVQKCRDVLPEDVYLYIKEHGLYQ